MSYHRAIYEGRVINNNGELCKVENAFKKWISKQRRKNGR